MYEVEGLPDSDPDDEFYPNAKKPSRVKFSSSPIKVGPYKMSTDLSIYFAVRLPDYVITGCPAILVSLLFPSFLPSYNC